MKHRPFPPKLKVKNVRLKGDCLPPSWKVTFPYLATDRVPAPPKDQKENVVKRKC